MKTTKKTYKLFKLNRFLKKNSLKSLLIAVPVIFFMLYIFFFNVYKTAAVPLDTAPREVYNTVRQKLEYVFAGDYVRTQEVIKYSKRNNIPALLTASVIFAESSNYPYAVSRVKARGLMQLMQNTAILLAKAEGNSNLAKIIKTNPAILFDTNINIRLGTRFLRELKAMSGGWAAVLHSYNVGPYAYKLGRRNHAYVNKILSMYNTLKSKNLAKIHKKYGKYLANLYGKKLDHIVMR